MKKIFALLTATAVLLTLAFSVPVHAREKSPPGFDVIVKAISTSHDVSIKAITNEVLPVTPENVSSVVKEDLAISQNYASYKSDVAFAPLYRWKSFNDGLVTTGDNAAGLNLDRINETGSRTYLFRPEKIPK